jgi:hypothetical protein
MRSRSLARWGQCRNIVIHSVGKMLAGCIAPGSRSRERREATDPVRTGLWEGGGASFLCLLSRMIAWDGMGWDVELPRCDPSSHFL